MHLDEESRCGPIIHLPEAAMQKTICLDSSEFPLDTGSFWSCIKQTDVALYRAKEEDRNRKFANNKQDDTSMQR